MRLTITITRKAIVAFDDSLICVNVKYIIQVDIYAVVNFMQKEKKV